MSEPDTFPLFTIEDLRTLPAPEWLIDDIIGLDTFVVLYGKPGGSKSFIGLDLALSIATGRDWHGHPVTPRSVLYIAAEGGRSITPRVEAWLQRAALTNIERAVFLMEAPQLHKPSDLKRLLTRIQSIDGLGLIIIDTLARAFVGGDENSATEMGKWIEGARQLQVATGATVLVVHHTGKDAGGERGSSALRGAADTMMKSSFNAATHVITVTCDKQKDTECFERLKFTLDCFPLDSSPKSVTSCVPIETTSKGARLTLNAGQQQMLDALGALGGFADSTSWRQATGIPKRTFHHHRQFLIEQGLVEGTDARYQLTERGRTSAKTGLALVTGSASAK